jgi:hypothetical protein
VDTAEHTLRDIDSVPDAGQVRMRWIGHAPRAEAGIVVAPDNTIVMSCWGRQWIACLSFTTAPSSCCHEDQRGAAVRGRQRHDEPGPGSLLRCREQRRRGV